MRFLKLGLGLESVLTVGELFHIPGLPLGGHPLIELGALLAVCHGIDQLIEFWNGSKTGAGNSPTSSIGNRRMGPDDRRANARGGRRLSDHLRLA
jgi:hypothetical protein